MLVISTILRIFFKIESTNNVIEGMSVEKDQYGCGGFQILAVAEQKNEVLETEIEE
jgi:hypothetical protein